MSFLFCVQNLAVEADDVVQVVAEGVVDVHVAASHSWPAWVPAVHLGALRARVQRHAGDVARPSGQHGPRPEELEGHLLRVHALAFRRLPRLARAPAACGG